MSPFMLADGSPAETRSINKVGLERADFSADEIEIARAVFKKIYRSDLNRGQAIDFIEKESPLRDHPVTQEIIAFAKKRTRISLKPRFTFLLYLRRLSEVNPMNKYHLHAHH